MVDFFNQQFTNRPLGTSDRATYSEIFRWIAVGALFVSLILAYAWSHNEILNINYRMEQLRKENSELRENNTALRAEYSSLVSPENIDSQARQLGLITPNKAAVKILDSDIPISRPNQALLAQTTLQKKSLHE